MDAGGYFIHSTTFNVGIAGQGMTVRKGRKRAGKESISRGSFYR